MAMTTEAMLYDKFFPIVEASKLTLEDEFLKYEPETKEQKMLKEAIIKAIKSGLSDFRKPAMDVSEDNEENIFFEEGNKPAVGHSPEWWEKTIKGFMFYKNSRIGTKKEYVAFLAILIKHLIANEGYKISKAWEAICNNSKDLGHYRDSENAKCRFEPTASRKVGNWYDLANAAKIIREDDSTNFLIAGGSFANGSKYCALAIFYPIRNSHTSFSDSTAWIVLDV